jgi:hypothetical protein
MVETPIGQVQVHIMASQIPFLLSLADMDKLSVYFNNLSNALITPNEPVPTVRRFGYPFLLWGASFHAFIAESFAYVWPSISC